MSMNLTPILWPRTWKDPSALSLLKGTAINCLLIDRDADLGTVAARAQQEGLTVVETGARIDGVTVVKGEWPGVKLNQSGQLDRAGAGPTGVPWVDSNGWKVRLASLLHPGTAVWVDAVPKLQRLFAQSYLVSVSDAAAHGGRWILSLDNQLAS